MIVQEYFVAVWRRTVVVNGEGFKGQRERGEKFHKGKTNPSIAHSLPFRHTAHTTQPRNGRIDPKCGVSAFNSPQQNLLDPQSERG